MVLVGCAAWLALLDPAGDRGEAPSAEAVRARMALLRPGMAQPAVERALGLDRAKVVPLTEGTLRQVTQEWGLAADAGARGGVGAGPGPVRRARPSLSLHYEYGPRGEGRVLHSAALRYGGVVVAEVPDRESR